ncbi:MAG: Uma2 family endonuclease [Coriobacteriales bacterium]|nr:Uma2 family endonuclease [Coriobacteriales bacterium]
MPQPKANYTAKDYWALPEGTRAELIDGELWNLASPSREHQEIVLALSAGLLSHITAHKGTCKVYPAPFAVNLFRDDTTFVEPDVSVVCDRNKLSERGCEGAPDLVIEVVSPSNPEMDYVSKLNLYREAGVREYWICDPLTERTLVYDFGSESVMALYAFTDAVPSKVLPDFSINFAQVVASM